MPCATLTTTLRDAIPLTRCRDYIPGRPHVATTHRWASRGVRGVVLGTVLVGGVRYTTPAMIEAFLRRLNDGSPVSDALDDVDLSRRAHEASKALEALGC